MTLEEIKNTVTEALSRGESVAFIELHGREAALIISNYGLTWFDKATMSDIERVAVY